RAGGRSDARGSSGSRQRRGHRCGQDDDGRGKQRLGTAGRRGHGGQHARAENGSRAPRGLTLERHIPEAIPPLVDAISSWYDNAIDRLLLTDERVTTAAEAKKELAGDGDTEAMADQVQRVVVLAVPVVRTLARGARFTRVPWVLVASTAFSIASTLRAGVREVQVIGSLSADP